MCPSCEESSVSCLLKAASDVRQTRSSQVHITLCQSTVPPLKKAMIEAARREEKVQLYLSVGNSLWLGETFGGQCRNVFPVFGAKSFFFSGNRGGGKRHCSCYSRDGDKICNFQFYIFYLDQRSSAFINMRAIFTTVEPQHKIPQCTTKQKCHKMNVMKYNDLLVLQFTHNWLTQYETWSCLIKLSTDVHVEIEKKKTSIKSFLFFCS